jgi:hypothetical protein
MVAMPYIMVVIVSNLLSFFYFSLTSAALLSKYPATTRFLPLVLRRYRALSFLAYTLLLLGLLSLGVYFTDTLRNVHIGKLFIFDLFFYIAFANSLVLAYQFLSKRLFLRMRQGAARRISIALCSFVMVTVPVLAVTALVVKLFVIK